MRFLDLDLDFFLDKNAYSSGYDGGRLGPDYKPWSVSRVRHFIEDRCALSTGSPIQGRIVERHDGVLEFWRTLIRSNRLKIPFEVIHIDAHPDLWVGDIIYRTSDLLHFNLERGLTVLENKSIHAGNYLTFGIAYGWVGSLTWVSLFKSAKDITQRDGDAKSVLLRENSSDKCALAIRLPARERERSVCFKVLHWRNFRTSEKFDYMALSKSPDFTPPTSDRLVDIIEEYMKQI